MIRWYTIDLVISSFHNNHIYFSSINEVARLDLKAPEYAVIFII